MSRHLSDHECNVHPCDERVLYIVFGGNLLKLNGMRPGTLEGALAHSTP
jgi:hypothetical protein